MATPPPEWEPTDEMRRQLFRAKGWRAMSADPIKRERQRLVLTDELKAMHREGLL